MEVKDLLAVLQTMPQDAEVIVFVPDTGNVVGVRVLQGDAHQAVVIEHDIDVARD